MSEGYEPITAELRMSMTHMDGHRIPMVELGMGEFMRLCDEIDAVHAQLERENDALRASAEQDHDGWIRLPLDADGVPIRVGDEVVDELDESTAPRKVTSIHLANDGWWVYIGGVGRRPDRYSHHHDPTVEDVLTKFGIDWEYESDCEDRAALLAEYAAKLRLAGDAE